MVIGALFVQAAGTSAAETPRVAQAPGATSEKSGASTEKMPGKGVAGAVKVGGIVDAVKASGPSPAVREARRSSDTVLRRRP